MSEMGITAIYPGPNLSQRNHKEGVYPYLLRHITSAYPNHVWGIDSRVHSLTSWLDVSGGDLGLVLPIRRQLGTRSNIGVALCAHGNATCFGTNGASDLQ